MDIIGFWGPSYFFGGWDFIFISSKEGPFVLPRVNVGQGMGT